MSALSKFVHRFGEAKDGVALMEFALALPILTLVTMGGIEAANLALVHLRVSQAASQVGDNVARVRDRIDESNIRSIMTGARLTGAGINIANKGRIVVATVEDNDATPLVTNDQVVTWQRCKGAHNPGTTTMTEGAVVTGGIGVGTNKISPTPNAPIIVSEVYYDYTPIFPLFTNTIFGKSGLEIFKPRTLVYRSAFIIRDRQVQTMQNAQGLSGSNLASCSLYNNT